MEGKGATYLKHIVDSYDSLADHTIFMQDDINNHIHDYGQFVNAMNHVSLSHLDFFQYPCTWNNNGPIYKRLIVNGCVTDIDPPWKCKLGNVCNRFGIQYPKAYLTQTCSFFAVSRDRIRIRPKSFYQALYAWVIENSEHEYILELLWYPIFTRPDDWTHNGHN